MNRIATLGWMAAEETETESDARTIAQPNPCFRSRTCILSSAAASLLLCATIVFLARARGPSTAPGDESEEKVQIIAEPGREHCASVKENCWSKGCCKTAGYKCFATYGDGMGKCMKQCDPHKGYNCTQPWAIMKPRLQWATSKPATSLYCFVVVVMDTGDTKRHHDFELVQYQQENSMGAFDCDQTGLFSDQPLKLKNGMEFWQVFDVEHNWHFAKRKATGTWINTGLFIQVWKAILQEGRWVTADWIVKVDADAVFVPSRLVNKLSYQLEVADGIYMVNCQYVDYGFFGNLEVFSKKAFSTFSAHIDDCKDDTNQINWKVGIKNGKYGPMGEDLFAQTCMDKWNVKKVDAFEMSQDGTCAAKRDPGQKWNKKWKPHCGSKHAVTYHPFKKVDQWAKCMGETLAQFPE